MGGCRHTLRVQPPSACHAVTRSPPLRAHKPGNHQQADADSREGEQGREQPTGHVPLAWGLGACRAEQVRLLRERAAQLLPQGVGVLPDLPAHVLAYGIGMVPDLPAYVFMPRVELLRQALRQRLMLGVQIAPCGLLGPEGEHVQERAGQGPLLVRRKPCFPQLLHGYLGVNWEGRRLLLRDVLKGFVRDALRSLHRVGHRISLTESSVMPLGPGTCSLPMPCDRDARSGTACPAVDARRWISAPLAVARGPWARGSA